MALSRSVTSAVVTVMAWGNPLVSTITWRLIPVFWAGLFFCPFQILSDQVIFFPADVTWVLMHFSHLPFGFPLLSFSCPLCQKFLNSLLRTEGTSDASDAKSFKKLRLFCTRVFPGETGTLHKLTLEFLAKSSIISSSFQVARPLEAEERRATSCFSEVI